MTRCALTTLTALAAVATLAAAGVGEARAAPAREVAKRVGANIQRPSWAPDGSKLSYEANFHDKKTIELYQGDPETGRFSRVLPTSRGPSSVTAGFNTNGGPGRVAHEVSWSPPRMKRFIYAASNDSNDYDLYILGGGPISPAPGADGGATWSPDGRWIAFTSARSGQGDLYLIDVTAIEARPSRLTSDPTSSELFAAWAPDSKRLVYVGHNSTGDNLYVLPEIRGTPMQLTRWPGIQTHPRFSPDGTKVAFYADKEGDERFDLYVVDAQAGAEPAVLARDVVPNATGPSWTPDGRHIVYTQNDDARYDPISAVALAKPLAPRALDFGTVGHGDLDVVGIDGKVMVAYVAQGKKVDVERSFKRLFVAELPPL